MPQSMPTPDRPCSAEPLLGPPSLQADGAWGQWPVFPSDIPVPARVFISEIVSLVHLSSQEKQLRGALTPACYLNPKEININ